MNNQAINNDIEKRAESLKIYYYTNPRRIATIKLLDEIADAIDFYQKQVNNYFEAIEYNKQQGWIASAKMRFHNWQIKKATLTRLQPRYKIVLEILMQTA